MTSQTRAMTEGAPWKHILRFSLPVLAGTLLQQLYSTVDAIVVGNFSGEAALSAVGTTGSFGFLLLAVAIGFSAGNGIIISQNYGAGNEKEMRACASAGILFMMGLGVMAGILGIAVSGPAYKYFVNVPEDYLDLTLRYFRIFSAGYIFQYGYNIFSSILRAVGDSAATLYFLIISSVMNIGLDLLFVAAFRWGVVGAAVATVISQAASFAAAYIYMTRKYPVFRFGIKEYRWDSKAIRETVRLGLPIALQLAIVSLGLTAIQRAVNGFGQAMTASFTVGHRMELYLNLPCNAFQTTLATYTGQNIGAGKPERVKQGVRQTILISLGMTLVISGAVMLLAQPISRLFGLSGQAAAYSLEHLRTVAMVNVILSLYIPLFGVFQGANHTAAPTAVATGTLSVRTLVTYLFRYSSFLGYRILWWNGLFGFGLGCLISWTYYLSGKWQKNSSIIGGK